MELLYCTYSVGLTVQEQWPLHILHLDPTLVAIYIRETS